MKDIWVTTREVWQSFALLTKRTQVWIMCCSAKTLGNFFHSIFLYTQLYKWVPGYIQRWTCVWQPLRINCSIWLDASQRIWDGVRLNRSAREVKCKSTLSNPEDWMLCYIRTYLFIFFTSHLSFAVLDDVTLVKDTVVPPDSAATTTTTHHDTHDTQVMVCRM